MPAPTLVPRPEDFRFSCDVEVRFVDLDAMGHVNNAVYLTYFEIARTRYSYELGLAEDGESDPAVLFPFILLDASCRFLAPASLGDRVRVHMRTAHIGTKSFVFEYLLTLGDATPVATGKTTGVCYDYSAGRTVPMPARIRDAFESYEGRRS